MAELSVASNTVHQSLFLETHLRPQTMTSCFSSCLLGLSGHLCWLLSSAHPLPELPRSPSPQAPGTQGAQRPGPASLSSFRPPSPGPHFALQQQKTNPNTGRRPNRLRPPTRHLLPAARPGPARTAPFCCDLESQLIKLSDPSLPTAEKTLSKHL